MNKRDKASRAKKKRREAARAARATRAKVVGAASDYYPREEIIKMIARESQMRRFMGLALRACGGRIVVPPSILADEKGLHGLFVTARRIEGSCLEISLVTAEESAALAALAEGLANAKAPEAEVELDVLGGDEPEEGVELEVFEGDDEPEPESFDVVAGDEPCPEGAPAPSMEG